MFNNSSVHVSVCSSVFVYIITQPAYLSVYTSVCMVLLYVFPSVRCPPVFLQVRPFVCPCICLFICFCVHTSTACPSICLPICLSGLLHVFRLSTHLFINQSTPPFAQLFCQSLCQSVCLLICLTVCLNLICSGISKVQNHNTNYFNTNLKYLEIL